LEVEASRGNAADGERPRQSADNPISRLQVGAPRREANGVVRRLPVALVDATLAVTERRNMNSSIICGVDGSADSERALAVAAQLADSLDLQLVLAHVVDHAYAREAAVGPLGAGVMTRSLVTADVQAYEDAAEQLLTRLADEAGLARVERRVASGFPAERLADLADEENAEMIVVGSRGRGAFKAAFLGSVSTSLIGIARCPVLVVPPGA
jgi:nucleotide-binding universal stress UspA family protein